MNLTNVRDQIAAIMDQRQLTGRYAELVKQAVADPSVQAWLTAHKDELADDAVTRGAAKIYEYVTARDGKGEDQALPNSGYMPQLVVSNRLIDIMYEPTPAKIAADQVAHQASLITSVNMPKAIRTAALEDYDPTGRAAALLAATRFTDAMDEAPQEFHRGLYLTGPFGVGKTYLLGAIANHLADRGIASTMVHYPTFALEIRNAINDHTTEDKLGRLKKVPVLMLDDIAAESYSAWLRDEVLGVLLQYRMQEELPTLFTSNKSMAELTDFLSGKESGKDLEEVRARRIMERIRFLADEIHVGGQERRNGSR